MIASGHRFRAASPNSLHGNIRAELHYAIERARHRKPAGMRGLPDEVRHW